jgi:hypothetical protein
MSGFETEKRVGFTKLEIDRLHHDVEDWRLNYDELTRGCCSLEDLIAKANFVFGRILKLDMDIQEFRFESPEAEADSELLHMTRDATTAWFKVSLPILERSEQLIQRYTDVSGHKELIINIRRAQAAGSHDEEYFDSEELVGARDKAIDSHHAGLTEPLLDYGNSAQ